MKPAQYHLKQREYLGRIPTMRGQVASWGKWVNGPKLPTIVEANRALSTVPTNGMREWAIFYRGKRVSP